MIFTLAQRSFLSYFAVLMTVDRVLKKLHYSSLSIPSDTYLYDIEFSQLLVDFGKTFKYFYLF